MMLQKMTLLSIIQRALWRHLCEIAEGYSHKLICDTYYKNVEQYVAFLLFLVMIENLFGHNKINFSTVEFGKWAVNRVKYIKCSIFAVSQ